MDFATYLRDQARIDGDARLCSLCDADRAAILAASAAILADQDLVARLAAIAEAIRAPQEAWDAAPWRELQFDPRAAAVPAPHMAWALALPVLFNVEAARADYAARAIPECILADTLRDLPRWVDNLADRTGGRHRGFTEIHWLRETLSLRLFQLGRLQFQPHPLAAGAEALAAKAAGVDVATGEPAISVHIPKGEPLDTARCLQSLAIAPNFFKRFFADAPVSKARFFQCSSWLLCPALSAALPETSRIRAFADLFDKGLPHGDDHSFFNYTFPAQGCAATAADAKTTLQRTIVSLRDGGTALQSHVGVIPVGRVRRSRPLRLGVLGSGSGSNMQSIQDAIEAGTLDAEIKVVITDVPGAKILDRAARHHIPAQHIDHAPFKTKLEGRAEDEVIEVLRKADVDVVVLAGYMRVVKPKLLAAFPDRVINIHPALLPSFPGIAGWTQALNYGAKVAGCTVHFVNAGIDSGPIIVQRAVPVEDADTPASLHARIQVQEHIAYPEALRLLAADRLLICGRRVITL